MAPPVDPDENSKQIVPVDQIAAYARAAGWSGNDVIIATAVSLAESTGDRTAVGRAVPDRPDYGLWQVNYIHNAELPGFFPPGVGWKNGLNNAYGAKKVWDSQGWTQGWTTFRSGAYKNFLTQAQQGASKNTTVPPIVNPNSPNETTTIPGGKIPDLVGGLLSGYESYLWIAAGSVLVLLGVLLLAKDSDIGQAAMGAAKVAALA